MHRRPILAAAAVAGLAGAALLMPVFAHEGHDKVETAPFDLDSPRKVSPETAAIIGLQTTEVDFGSIDVVLRLTGVVKALPDRVQAVSAKVDGTVTSVTPRVGDIVHRGGAIAEIESPGYLKLLTEVARANARVEQLQVETAVTAEQASLAESELVRVQANTEVVATNVLSEKHAAAVTARGEARRREIELPLARAELEAIQRQVVAIRRSIGLDESASQETDSSGRLRLLAGMDGVVIARNVVNGQGVQAGQTLVEIADYSKVQVEGELPESLFTRLGTATGNAVRVRRNVDGESIAIGTLRFISPVVDPIKRTTHVVIEADNPEGALRDGMFVDLSIVLREEKNAVVVPTSAVVSDGPMQFVFMKEGDVFKKHDITPGYRDDRVVEVLQGLAPGDVVVSQGAYSLTQLRPKVAAPVATAPAQTTKPATGQKG